MNSCSAVAWICPGTGSAGAACAAATAGVSLLRRHLRGSRRSRGLLGRRRRFVDVRRQEQHQAHQHERQQEPHLHGEFFLAALCLLDWHRVVLERFRYRPFRLEAFSEPDRSRPGGTDGSAANGGMPRRHPARHAIFRNRFEHVFRAGGMKPAGRRQKRRKEPLVETQSGDYCFPHCVTNRSTSRRSSSGERFQGGAPRVDHNIPLRADFVQTNPQRFSHTPLHPIPHHRLSEGSRNRESQPRPLARARAEPAGKTPQSTGSPSESLGYTLCGNRKFSESERFSENRS